METRVFISFASGALIAGILCGVLIYNLLERSIKKVPRKTDRVTHILTINTEGQQKDSAEVFSEGYTQIGRSETIDSKPLQSMKAKRNSSVRVC